MPIPNNGVATEHQAKFIDGINPDDPEYQRLMMRPAEIKEDVKFMEQRKRVSLILNSEAFRRELEAIISTQKKSGPPSASLLALQQISDLLMPQNQYNNAPPSSTKIGGVSIIAINDFRSGELGLYTKSERQLRCKLASTYRLVDIHGWNTGIHNHITVRISRDHEHFLINPYGLLYHEVTASSLLKVDMKGEVLDQGTTHLCVDRSGWILHSAVYAARSDIRCILHLNMPSAVAVSCMKQGLLPLSPAAMCLGQVAFYDPDTPRNGTAVHSDREEEGEEEGGHADERQAIARALGAASKVLLVKNYGLLALGDSIEEAWHYASNAVTACETQLRLASVGLEHLVLPSEEVVQRVQEEIRLEEAPPPGSPGPRAQTGHVWKRGEMQFEAMMRHLDNSGYRTGYFYHQSSVRQDRPIKRHEDVEIPPTASSFVFNYDDEAEYAKMTQKMLADRQKSLQRATTWLNTPNVYHREEIEEINTPNPKKITRWVSSKPSEDQPHRTGTGGISTQVTNANQFAPQGMNPKEFKEHQKKVKSKYYFDTTTAGPQSKLLDGVTYDEARRMREESMAKQHADQTVIVGAASKGIIQRDHRHNAVVYQSVWSANPFDRITDDDLARYHKDVEVKRYGKGSGGAFSDSELDRDTAPILSHAEYSALDSAPESSPISRSVVQRTESARVSEPPPPQDLSKPSVSRTYSEKRAPTASTLSPTRAETMRSDTSGADASQSEREAPDTSASKDKKKKKRFKLPSFAKKSKDKDKHK